MKDDPAARIASALHDQTGPHLFALNVALYDLRMALQGADPAVRQALCRAEQQAEALAKAIRSAMDELSPLGDLPQMLHELARSLSGPCARVIAQVDTAPTVSDRDAAIAYRFAREAALNALRHGGAQRVHLKLSEDAGWVVVQVADNGKGPPARLVMGRGLGGIAKRAADIGAEWCPPRRQGTMTTTELRIRR